MGQKVPPKANRLGVTEDSDSTTFAEFRSGQFAHVLQEDTAVRKYLKKKLKNAGLSRILIQRKPGQIQVNLVTARPGLIFGKGNEGVEMLKKELNALIHRNDLLLQLNVFEVNKIDIDAQLIAESITQQLERRIAFRRAMKQAIQRAMRAGAKGIKIISSGRLSGIEIARSEKDHEGSVPCHTWRADIDYGFAEAMTTYGIIGVKVWVNKGLLMPGEKSKPNIKAAAGGSAMTEETLLAA
jgi:small subunit ribosomal protein S3